MQRSYVRLYKNLLGIGVALLCLTLLLPGLHIAPADAQPQSPSDINREQELDERIQTFFQLLRNNNSMAAFDGLLIQSPLSAPAALPQLNELRSKTEEAKNQFGEILNWERFDTKSIGLDVVVIRYILKYDQYPVIWTFAFYRKPSESIINTNRWVLVELQFAPNLI